MIPEVGSNLNRDRSGFESDSGVVCTDSEVVSE
jgi:hypothetical protein